MPRLEDQYLPVVTIRGSSEERGRQHGTLLKDRIHRTVAFYKRQFQLPEHQVMAMADHFRKSTRAFCREIFIEMEALAEAAGVDKLWIYALNGRTELLNAAPMECTALAFKKQGLLGQNWDWDTEMESLAVILDIEKEDGHRILSMTEPGMIGKIGMNNSGLGVCLNFMTIENFKARGVPLHVLLRSILDSKSLSSARSRIEPHLFGKVGNLLILNGTGDALDLEMAGDVFFTVPVGDRFAHTNHFLTDIAFDLKLFPNSAGRYRRAKELLKGVDAPGIHTLKQILKDDEDKDNPICRKRFSHPWLTDDSAITVTTIVMDVKNLWFHITRGNPFDNPFTAFSLAE